MLEDVDGKIIGRTVIVRESVWDDDARRDAYMLHRRNQGLCPCGCGLPAEQTLDAKLAWNVGDYVCYATRARLKQEAVWKKQHQKAADGPPTAVHHYVIGPVEDTRGLVAAGDVDQAVDAAVDAGLRNPSTTGGRRRRGV